jgi:hypothetical protein
MSGVSGAFAEPSPAFACRKNDQVPEHAAEMTQTLQMSRMPARLALTLTALVAATFGAQAATQPIVISAHSSTAAANCWPIDGTKEAADNATRVCRGKATWVVLVNKDAGRETVSVGHNRDEAAREPAAQASFGPFKVALPSIEWRTAGNNPFAIIQRWRTTDNDGKPMLVVTKLPPGAVCPVAYVDAAANANADELARQAADQIARDFKCGTDQPKVLGTSGRTAEFATKR